MKLERAIKFAAGGHQGQKDKAGKPYILHLLHVMAQMQTEEEMIVAVLHDLIEDTTFHIDGIVINFSQEVADTIMLLTHQEDDSYSDYINKIADSGDKIAVKVKMADLVHNQDVTRLSEVTQKDLDRIEIYHWAWRVLWLAN